MTLLRDEAIAAARKLLRTFASSPEPRRQARSIQSTLAGAGGWSPAEREAPIPIIALTANAMPQQIEGYIEAGMNAAVTKPINLTQLFETLAKTLAAPPAQRRARARRKA